jgi:hypothetical protein
VLEKSGCAWTSGSVRRRLVIQGWLHCEEYWVSAQRLGLPPQLDLWLTTKLRNNGWWAWQMSERTFEGSGETCERNATLRVSLSGMLGGFVQIICSYPEK